MTSCTYVGEQIESAFSLSYLYFPALISESTSDIVSGSYGGQPSRLVYAVFTTPQNSISGNAICAFRLRDLLDTFEGAFKEQGRKKRRRRTK